MSAGPINRAMACLGRYFAPAASGLAIAMLAGCAMGPPHITVESGVASDEEIWANTLIPYAVDTEFRTRRGVTTYSLWSLGGKQKLPVRRYSPVCNYEFGSTTVRILGLPDDGDTICPARNPASVLDQARGLTGRPLAVDLYFDGDAQYFYQHKGRIEDAFAPLSIAMSFAGMGSFFDTLESVLHESFHIQDGLSDLGLSPLDEELNAYLFAMCLTAPHADTAYIDGLRRGARQGLENIQLTNVAEGVSPALYKKRNLGRILQSLLSDKDRIVETGEDPGGKKKYLYHYLPQLVFLSLGDFEGETPDLGGFKRLCSDLSGEGFRRGLTIGHIERARGAGPQP